MKKKKSIFLVFFVISLTLISCEKNTVEFDTTSAANQSHKPLKAPVVGKEVVKANDFLNSMGICCHVNQNLTPTDFISMAIYLGIRNARGAGTADNMIRLRNEAGVRSIVMAWNDQPFETEIPLVISKAKALIASDALLAIEGMNEPNNFPLTYEGVTSSPTNSVPIAHAQRDLYAQVKADPQLANYPVFHSSLAAGSEAQNLGMQFLTIPGGAGTLMPDGTKYADYANIHNYYWGHSSFVDNAVWRMYTLGTDIVGDAMYGEHCNTWKNFAGYPLAQLPSLQRVVTECGFPTVAETGYTMLSDTAQGKALLNCYLDAYKQGFSYNFWYQVKDDVEYFGLYRSDNTMKVGATYLHNMTTILADNSSNFTPGSVNYSIVNNSSLNKPETVHDMLLQKSNGTYELVIWSERVSGTNDISIDLGTNYTSVTLYDPTVGTWAVRAKQSNVRWVELHTMSDHPLIIEISGGISLPDMILTSLSYDPLTGNFTSVVKNQGTAPTPTGVYLGVEYSVDGVNRTFGGVSGPLAAGASINIGSDGGAYTIPIGTHTIMAFVDDVNRFAESNENNNTLSQTIGPDVIVTSLTYNASTGIFSSIVKNQGNIPTPAGVFIGVEYSVDGVNRTWGGVWGPLSAGSSIPIGTDGVAYTIPVGTHTIMAFADDASRFAETNENNNTFSNIITR